MGAHFDGLVSLLKTVRCISFKPTTFVDRWLLKGYHRDEKYRQEDYRATFWKEMSEQSPIASQIQSKLGPGTTWQPDQGLSATVWPLQSFDLVWVPDHRRDSDLRSIWHARSKSGAQPVIVVTSSEQQDRVRVLGPQDPQTP